jgi:hypothetical protein
MGLLQATVVQSLVVHSLVVQSLVVQSLVVQSLVVQSLVVHSLVLQSLVVQSLMVQMAVWLLQEVHGPVPDHVITGQEHHCTSHHPADADAEQEQPAARIFSC